MKKFLVAIFCAIAFALSPFSVAGCGNGADDISVYMPDGAPALAMAQHMFYDADFDRNVKYRVVDSSVIQNYVTGANPSADLCVLPLNMASKLLGDADKYRMLGTVTHGNLFILKKADGEDINVGNLSSLVGKTVGVIMLSSVPGLTFKAVLKDNGIDFKELGNGGGKDSDKVNLKSVTPAEVLPTESQCDYYLVPEPAATTKVTATSGKLSFAGSLQELYGDGNGYPQAVLVAKNSLIENDPDFINSFLDSMRINCDWLESQNIESYKSLIVKSINAHMTEGSVSSLNAGNLNSSVIKNCAIAFIPALQDKQSVEAFLEKLIALNPASASAVSENFYYKADV